MLRIKNVLVVMLLSSCTSGTVSHKTEPSAKAEEDGVLAMDFISYDYKFLDKDYKLKISKEDFNKAVDKYHFYPSRIKKHSDSLSVVLMWEFNDWHTADIAKRRILFDWKRLGFYLRRDEIYLKDLAKKIHASHPYLVYSYFKSDEKSTVKSKEIRRLREILAAETGKPLSEISQLRNNDLLNLAFENDPEVKAMREKLRHKN